MNYKISIIVPVYNAERYLKQCIDSILNQTINSLELILLDDGSKDNSGTICDEYAEKFDNIRVLHLKNGGPARARNIGVNEASGEYVGFVDSDDYVDLKMYDDLYSKAKETDSEIVMCSCYIENAKETVPIVMNYNPIYKDKEVVNKLLARYSTLDHIGLFSVCNKIIKKSFIMNNKLFFPEDLIRAEDAWFVFDCLKYAKIVSFIDTPYYYYRQVETSTMHTIQPDQFKRSKEFRIKLQSENERLNIIYDKNEFYYDFLYECFVYCRSMYQQKNKDSVNLVLYDDFFVDACKYNKCLPVHLKFICVLVRAKAIFLVKQFLKFWAKI